MISEKSVKAVCKFLEWDSGFFNVRIARLLSETLTGESADSALFWCSEKKIDCLYFLANPEDGKTIEIAERHDFSLTDIRITFGLKLASVALPGKNDYRLIETASASDIPQLKRLASANHFDSRFYFDRNFSREKADELFAIWIENSCLSPTDKVFVVKSGDLIKGYITCLIDDKKEGSIGLLGVNPDFQGQGIGRLLVGGALEWFRKNKVEDVTVVTQGRNIKAQGLYQKCGFTTSSLKIWYHKWFD